MVTISNITDTTMRGLGIGVLAGVSGNVLKSMSFLHPTKRKRRRKGKR